jgi:hypothetical protein
VSSGVHPPPRQGAAFSLDERRKHCVLFGGINAQEAKLSDVWTWSGQTWSKQDSSSALQPGARSGSGLVYNRETGRHVLFGGLDNGSEDKRDTWELGFRGGQCQTNEACGTGFCVDGVCCKVEKCGTCQTCSGGSNPGICAAVLSADDPDTCKGVTTCNAQGQCAPSLGAACIKSSECASGFCTEGVCCNESCLGSCQTCKKSESATDSADGLCSMARVKTNPRVGRRGTARNGSK